MANHRKSAGGEGLGLPLTMPNSLHIPGLNSRPVPARSGIIADHTVAAAATIHQQAKPITNQAKPKRTGFRSVKK